MGKNLCGKHLKRETNGFLYDAQSAVITLPINITPRPRPNVEVFPQLMALKQ